MRAYEEKLEYEGAGFLRTHPHRGAMESRTSGLNCVFESDRDELEIAGQTHPRRGAKESRTSGLNCAFESERDELEIGRRLSRRTFVKLGKHIHVEGRRSRGPRY